MDIKLCLDTIQEATANISNCLYNMRVLHVIKFIKKPNLPRLGFSRFPDSALSIYLSLLSALLLYRNSKHQSLTPFKRTALTYKANGVFWFRVMARDAD